MPEVWPFFPSTDIKETLAWLTDVRITPQGKVDRIIEMPVERPTKPMFGGRNLDILYVTSIGSDEKDAQDGNLFAVTGLGVTGVEQARFAA